MMSILLLVVSEAEGAESSSALPQLDTSTYPGQLFWLLICFGGLYWLMSSVFLPKLGGIIEERRNRIADDYDQAAELKRDAEEAEKAYLQALSDAKAKAASIAAETRAELDGEISGMQAEMDKKLSTRIAAAETRIAEMKTQAAAKVSEAAFDTTRALVEALIDEMPAEDAVKAAVVTATRG